MEAACFQTKAILDAMAMDSGKSLTELAVDGGMSNSDICMQVRQYSQPNPHLTPLTFVSALDPSRYHSDSCRAPLNARDYRSWRRHRRRFRHRHLEGFLRTEAHEPRKPSLLLPIDDPQSQRQDV